jgi:hypothetical protein
MVMVYVYSLKGKSVTEKLRNERIQVYKNPIPIKYGLKIQKEENGTILTQKKPPLPHFLPLYPHTTADRYAHLQLSSFTLPTGHILKPFP